MTAETIERPRQRPEVVCLGSAVVGAVVWGAGLFLVSWPSWAEPLVALGALVVCPLALFVTAPGERYPWPWRAAVWMQFPAALLLLPSFARNPGPIAGSLALPWLLVTVLIALFGLLRLLSHRRGPVEEWAIDAGLLYLAVGGGWLILSRLGARPLDFGEPIILLTAGHFHYAGLALPILTGLASRELGGSVARPCSLAVIVGVPLVALGITVNHLEPSLALVEGLSAWFLGVVCLVVAWLQLRLALRQSVAMVRLLFLISAGSLAAGMVLAIVYAAGMYWQTYWLDVPTMIRTHAVINAVGFALAGLLGWVLSKR
jgi:hypothetical protein